MIKEIKYSHRESQQLEYVCNQMITDGYPQADEVKFQKRKGTLNRLGRSYEYINVINQHFLNLENFENQYLIVVGFYYKVATFF